MKSAHVFIVALLAGCSGGASAPPLLPSSHLSLSLHRVHRHSAGLGSVLTSKNGEIYGYDIDQSGTDGLLSTALDVETFDTNTGKIVEIDSEAYVLEHVVQHRRHQQRRRRNGHQIRDTERHDLSEALLRGHGSGDRKQVHPQVDAAGQRHSGRRRGS